MEECTSQSRGSRGKSQEGHGGIRELGARRKSDCWQESSRGRRRLSENQKLRVDNQVLTFNLYVDTNRFVFRKENIWPELSRWL